MTSRPSTLQDLLARFRSSIVADLHTSLPGEIVRYDSSTQKADVRPLVKERYTDESGSTQARDLPVIPAVPVKFPGGGGYRMTFPMDPGDAGLIVFCEASLDKWLVSGGTVDPADDRRHDLTDAVFIPGLRDFGHPLQSAPTDRATFGKDDGLQIHITPSLVNVGSNSPAELEFAALGDALQTWCGQIYTWLAALELPVAGAVAGPPAVPPPTVPTLKSASVQVKK
ncbi:hypothetical protein K0U83_00680 [bacterium]|nr:hypothetical protein [bacterium]